MSHNSLLEHGHFDYSLILQFCISFVVDEGKLSPSNLFLSPLSLAEVTVHYPYITNTFFSKMQ